MRESMAGADASLHAGQARMDAVFPVHHMKDLTHMRLVVTIWRLMDPTESLSTVLKHLVER